MANLRSFYYLDANGELRYFFDDEIAWAELPEEERKAARTIGAKATKAKAILKAMGGIDAHVCSFLQDCKTYAHHSD